MLDHVDLAKKRYRRYNQLDRVRVIACRYGSTSDFSQVIRSYKEISQHLAIPSKTVESIIRKFRRSGQDIE